uniref:Uncharacterized protein n=1 Tax=Anguilla anguilla TaxID=7936 RepID=A0A0E9PCK4_ANGAN
MCLFVCVCACVCELLFFNIPSFNLSFLKTTSINASKPSVSH